MNKSDPNRHISACACGVDTAVVVGGVVAITAVGYARADLADDGQLNSSYGHGLGSAIGDAFNELANMLSLNSRHDGEEENKEGPLGIEIDSVGKTKGEVTDFPSDDETKAASDDELDKLTGAIEESLRQRDEEHIQKKGCDAYRDRRHQDRLNTEENYLNVLYDEASSRHDESGLGDEGEKATNDDD